MVQYMDLKEFQADGYLQEVNRRFLHPLGLALEMQTGDDDDAYVVMGKAHLTALANCTSTVEDRSGSEDDALDAAWKAIDRARSAILGGVWDYRDDPEGMEFGLKPKVENGYDPVEFAEKANHIREIWNARKRARVTTLGWMVQPYDDTFFETGSDIVKILGDALGEEMNKVLPVKATSESWAKAARGMLDKACESFSGEPYDTTEVTPEEVHLIDILLGAEAMSGTHTRAEALNMLIDSRKVYKDVGESAAAALHRIATGDIDPGMSPMDMAQQALEQMAGQLGG